MRAADPVFHQSWVSYHRFDRRGDGRSDQTRDGNDIDSYADDLSTIIETLQLTNAILVGHSTGGSEVARYVGTAVLNYKV